MRSADPKRRQRPGGGRCVGPPAAGSSHKGLCGSRPGDGGWLVRRKTRRRRAMLPAELAGHEDGWRCSKTAQSRLVHPRGTNSRRSRQSASAQPSRRPRACRSAPSQLGWEVAGGRRGEAEVFAVLSTDESTRLRLDSTQHQPFGCAGWRARSRLSGPAQWHARSGRAQSKCTRRGVALGAEEDGGGSCDRRFGRVCAVPPAAHPTTRGLSSCPRRSGGRGSPARMIKVGACRRTRIAGVWLGVPAGAAGSALVCGCVWEWRGLLVACVSAAAAALCAVCSCGEPRCWGGRGNHQLGGLLPGGRGCGGLRSPPLARRSPRRPAWPMVPSSLCIPPCVGGRRRRRRAGSLVLVLARLPQLTGGMCAARGCCTISHARPAARRALGALFPLLLPPSRVPAAVWRSLLAPFHPIISRPHLQRSPGSDARAPALGRLPRSASFSAAPVRRCPPPTQALFDVVSQQRLPSPDHHPATMAALKQICCCENFPSAAWLVACACTAGRGAVPMSCPASLTQCPALHPYQVREVTQMFYRKGPLRFQATAILALQEVGAGRAISELMYLNLAAHRCQNRRRRPRHILCIFLRTRTSAPCTPSA